MGMPGKGRFDYLSRKVKIFKSDSPRRLPWPEKLNFQTGRHTLADSPLTPARFSSQRSFSIGIHWPNAIPLFAVRPIRPIGNSSARCKVFDLLGGTANEKTDLFHCDVAAA